MCNCETTCENCSCAENNSSWTTVYIPMDNPMINEKKEIKKVENDWFLINIDYDIMKDSHRYNGLNTEQLSNDEINTLIDIYGDNIVVSKRWNLNSGQTFEWRYSIAYPECDSKNIVDQIIKINKEKKTLELYDFEVTVLKPYVENDQLELEF